MGGLLCSQEENLTYQFVLFLGIWISLMYSTCLFCLGWRGIVIVSLKVLSLVVTTGASRARTVYTWSTIIPITTRRIELLQSPLVVIA
jgi:hypothetical protein